MLGKGFLEEKMLVQRGDCSWRRKRRCLYLPQGVSLLGEELEVLLGQLHRGQRLQPQVCGAPDKAGEVGKGVEAQAVVAVVGQVGHENADLGAKGAFQAWHTKNPICCPHLVLASVPRIAWL